MQAKIVLIIATVVLFVSTAFSQVPYRIRMADSTYTAQLRGKSSTRTDGLTIQGSYSNTFKAHEFDITISGYYDLWFDAAGGSNYSKDAAWSGSNGKFIVTGYFDDAIDTDHDYKVDAIDDSVVGLSNLSTAAYNYIGSGGSITNNPDDISIQNIGPTNLGVKDSYIFVSDTSTLKSFSSSYDNKYKYLKQLSSSTDAGGGLFVRMHEDTILYYFGAGQNVDDSGTIFDHPDADYKWVRVERLSNPDIVRPEWYGANTRDSEDDAPAINKAARKYANIKLSPGNYYVSEPIHIGYAGVRLIGATLGHEGASYGVVTFIRPIAGCDTLVKVDPFAGQVNAARVYIQDIGFSGWNPDSSKYAIDGFAIYSSQTETHVERCWFSDITGYAGTSTCIKFDQFQCHIKDSRADDCDRFAYMTPATNSSIVRTKVTDCNQYAVELDAPFGFELFACDFTGADSNEIILNNPQQIRISGVYHEAQGSTDAFCLINPTLQSGNDERAFNIILKNSVLSREAFNAFEINSDSDIRCKGGIVLQSSNLLSNEGEDLIKNLDGRSNINVHLQSVHIWQGTDDYYFWVDDLSFRGISFNHEELETLSNINSHREFKGHTSKNYVYGNATFASSTDTINSTLNAEDGKGALYFDGSGTATIPVTGGNDDDMNCDQSFTMIAYYKPLAENGFLLYKGGAAADRIRFYANISFRMQNDVASYDQTLLNLSPPNINDWNMVAITGDTANTTDGFKMYWNGDSATYPAFNSYDYADVDHNPATEVVLGSNYYGYLGYIAKWDTALAASDIRALWNNGVPPDIDGEYPANLVEYYNFEEMVGDTAFDQVDGNYMLIGDAKWVSGDIFNKAHFEGYARGSRVFAVENNGDIKSQGKIEVADSLNVGSSTSIWKFEKDPGSGDFWIITAQDTIVIDSLRTK